MKQISSLLLSCLLLLPTGMNAEEDTPKQWTLRDCIDYRSEEHTSELQSQSLISYAVFCLKKKKILDRIAEINK